MEITKKDIKFVDNWLQFAGINYVDVRFELVDHLISEYENSPKNESLETFVRTRLEWCKRTAKKKENIIHWGIQKQLWKRFFSLFTELKVIAPIVSYLALIILIKDSLGARTERFLFFTPVFITFLIFLYQSVKHNLKRKQKKLKEKVLALLKLETLMAFPQMIICLPSLWSENLPSLFNNTNLAVPIIIILTLVNIAAIYEYIEGQKRVQGQLQELLG